MQELTNDQDKENSIRSNTKSSLGQNSNAQFKSTETPDGNHPSQLQKIVDTYLTSKHEISNKKISPGVIQRAIKVTPRIEKGAVVIKAIGEAEEFKNGTKGKDVGWNGVEKYFARYKLNGNREEIGPLDNDYLRAEAGHVLASQNGGLGDDQNNIFAQDGGVNNSTYRREFENPMNDALEAANPKDIVDFRAVLYGKDITNGKLLKESDDLYRSDGEYDATSSEEDSELSGSDEELTFNEWMNEIADLVYDEYELELEDLPDEPFRDGYEDGMSPEDFFEEFMSDGKAY